MGKDVTTARAHGHAKAALAANKWGDAAKAAALAAFKRYAKKHMTFTTEDVRFDCDSIDIPGDPRGWGHIAKAAQREGYIEPKGYAPVRSSNGSPKVLWRSLIGGK